VGADLYLEPVFSENREQWEPLFKQAAGHRDKLPKNSPEFDAAQAEVMRYFDRMHARGYFRDSYNNWNLLQHFGLDWWGDIIPMLDKQGRLSVKRAIEFRVRLWAREPLFEDNLARLPKKDQRYFRGRYRKLLRFLKEAIDKRLPIDAWL
jgi:hypothetical protein